MEVPETLDWSGLSFPVEVKLIPVSQNKQRTGIAMDPQSLTWHETANYKVGSDADMHSRWLDNGAEDQFLSVHFFVDANKAIQKIPLNEVSWHAGDGFGPGNYTSLSFEFCTNPDGDFEKTFKHMAELFGYIMWKLGIDPDDMVQHNLWMSKDCPRILRRTERWGEAVALVAQYHHEFSSPITKPSYATPATIPFKFGIDLGWKKIGSTDVYSFMAQGTARSRVIKRAWAQDSAPVSGLAYELGDHIVLCGEMDVAVVDAAGDPVLDKDGNQKYVGWYIDSDGNRIRRSKVATSFKVVR